ncbi:restriction endonuclease subunit S [Stutzerimonas stutzeri]|uniref:Restriction endonuclease subunit S n=1 Tax=Stutzerimonas stutzeri TaxID=316 RepID=A0ABD4Y3V6_STUST|nr:restriction endonuclease subunit S [Stutzerimonas stutzeri]MDH0689860.1 restriction endonuclease subunit S [Stutzerimonas stutzeri]
MSSEWAYAKLGDLTINLDTKRKPVKEADRKAGPYPYYGASGVVDYVDGYIFDGEHLLIAEDGENLRTRQTPIAFRACGKFWVNNHAHIVVGNGRASTRYLEYAVLGSDITSYLTGAVMPKLTQGNLNRIEVPCPPRAVQDAIVAVLGNLDDRITLLRETNATLEAIAQALFKSWFVDFDPVRAKAEGRQPEGMDATTAALFPDSFEESELGLVPKGWSVMPIGEAVECVGGGTPDTKNEAYWQPEEFSWSSPKDLSGLQSPVLLSTERKLSAQGLTKVSSGLLPSGTLLMSSRAPIGYLAIAQTALAVNQGYIAMLPGGRLPPLYLLFWCRENMEIIKGRANGSTFMEISKKAFRPIPASVPPADVLEAFEQIAGSLFERLVANERQAQTLTQLRDTLLPRLIYGQLRLPEAQAVLNDMDIAQ